MGKISVSSDAIFGKNGRSKAPRGVHCDRRRRGGHFLAGRGAGIGSSSSGSIGDFERRRQRRSVADAQTKGGAWR